MCSFDKRGKRAFDLWWEKQVKGADTWTTLERLAALDAWMEALKWSGYFEMQESKKEPNVEIRRAS